MEARHERLSLSDATPSRRAQANPHRGGISLKVLVAGASGLVGGEVLRLAGAAGIEAAPVGRRAIGLPEEIITDFRSPLAAPAADAAICCLGTTMASAGSRDAFFAVDHDAVLLFARAAKDAGVEHFLVVTAAGADPASTVYYSRVKGQVEEDLTALAFRRLDILQPGLLLGPRPELRPVEKFLQSANPLLRLAMIGPLDRYAGIPAARVAHALIALCSCSETGVYRHENRQLRALT